MQQLQTESAQWNRMGRIRLFPLLFQNGCSLSSRFPTAGWGEWSSGNEIEKLSSWKVSTHSIISRAIKSLTNEHTVRGKPTRKDVKRFRNGSVCKHCNKSISDQFASEHFEWIYHETSYTKVANNRGYQPLSLINSIFRSVVVFFDVIANQARIPARTQERPSKKSRKVREFVYECVCSSTPK